MSYSVSIDPIDTVKPYEKNPRQITPDAISKVAKSIKQYGFRSPIVVDTDRIILAGHTRLQAAQKLGMKKIPVHVAEGLSENEKKSYRLADNRSAEESRWDFPMLTDELTDLMNDDFNLSDTLFDEIELARFLNLNDEDHTNDESTAELRHELLLTFETEMDLETWFHKAEKEGVECKIL